VHESSKCFLLASHVLSLNTLDTQKIVLNSKSTTAPKNLCQDPTGEDLKISFIKNRALSERDLIQKNKELRK